MTEPKATFNAAAEETLAKALEICTQRGTEYQDSWATENLKTPFLDNLVAALRPQVDSRGEVFYSSAEKRLIVLASLCDVKLSRLTGAYKEDTAVDLINYVAAYNALRLAYDEEHKTWTETYPSAGGVTPIIEHGNAIDPVALKKEILRVFGEGSV